MIDDDKPYDRAEDVYCYYLGMMIVEFSEHNQKNLSLFNDYINEVDGKLEFKKSSLFPNTWQVRCQVDSAIAAVENLRDFIGQFLLSNHIYQMNMNCHFSLEWLNYKDIGNDVNEPIDDYILGSHPYTVKNLLISNPVLLQWRSPNWVNKL